MVSREMDFEERPRPGNNIKFIRYNRKVTSESLTVRSDFCMHLDHKLIDDSSIGSELSIEFFSRISAPGQLIYY